MSQSKLQIERDCTEKCKSVQHGDLLSAVITKRQVTDEELCAYIRWLCSACGQICDSVGRTALHFAASCGRTKLVKWLIRNRGALINAKDLESGYTALHRSIFYGKINVAVTLIQLGANVGLMDHNDLTPIEHAMKDRMSEEYSKYELYGNNQIYVWGTNTNYTLGTGSQHSRQLPELNEAFHKKNSDYSVRQICLEKFHCVFITDIVSGSDISHVFSCGHGQGGRLGLNTEKTILVPQEIRFPKHRGEYFYCVQANIARDHSMFLSILGVVMTCGLNTHHVLGIKPPPKQILVPTYVPLHNNCAEGICAGRFHSVAWGSGFVYTWGLHAGQLGHPQSTNTTIIGPKLVANFTSQDTIISVAASDGATVVATKKGDVFALHEYQCRKIASRQLNIDKLVVIGGHLNPKVSSDILTEKGGNELKVLVLLKSGNLLIWQESWPQLCRCIYNLNRPLIAVDAVLSVTELFFVTNDGEAFKGEFRTRKKKLQEPAHTEKKSAFHEFLDKDDCQIVNVTKYPHVHRAIKIECDHKGRNFAAIQNAPQVYSMDGEKWPRSTIKKDMLNLFNNANEMDNIHDAVFKVTGHVYPVHKYIIGMESEPLYSLLQANTASNPVEIPNINPYLFKQILIYIYTHTCDFLFPGDLKPEIVCLCKTNNENNVEEVFIEVNGNRSAYECYKKKQKNPSNKNTSDLKNPLVIFHQAAKRFGIKSLTKKINKLHYINGKIRPRNDYFDDCYYDWGYKEVEFDRNKLTNLCDVVIKSENGGEIQAHKCILTRVEYFSNLFAVRWNENSSKSIISLPVSYNVLEAVIEFLYTDNILKNSRDLDHVCNVLVICDQLFIEELKEICEKFLSDLLTLRNVSQILQFAYTYNTNELKYNCMCFIIKNLSAVLESKSLETLEDKVLDELTNYYCYKDILSKRVITPFSNAPSDEEVKSIFELYPVNIEDSDQESFEKKTPKLNTRKRLRTRKSSNSESSRNKTTSESNMDSSFEHNISFSETFEEDIIEKKPEKKTENKTDEKWVKILTEKQKHQQIVQNRLKAIASAKEELETEKINHDENLTKLVSLPKIIPKTESPNVTKSPITSPILTRSPLQSPNTSNISCETIKSPTMNDIPIQKAQKLSQKQRKKLAAEVSISSLAQDLDRINKKPSWNTMVWSKENNSFSDIMKNEKKEFPDVNIGSASPKNPWQKIEVPSPVASPETKRNFKDIVADEKKLKENWTKMRDRPLIFIQMEDKAISDLERFYNIDQVSDEYITIHKVDKGAFAVPLWVQPNNKH